MTESQNTILNELAQLSSQYKAEVPGVRRAWPESVKSRIRLLLEDGMTAAEVSRKTGIPYFTLNSWRQRSHARFIQAKLSEPQLPANALPEKRKRGRPRKSHLLPATVTVANLASRKPLVSSVTSEASGTVTVTTPNGFKIEGLPINVALRLIGRSK